MAQWGLATAGIGALVVAGSLFFQAPSTRLSVAIIESPSAQRVLLPTDSVALRVRLDGGANTAPDLFVLTPNGGATVVPLDWTIDNGTARVEGPAYVLTGGHFGRLQLAVAPAGTPASEAIRIGAADRASVRVALPTYSLQRAVAVLSSRTRSGQGKPATKTIFVPQAAQSLVLTLRPDVTVRSGTVVCLFEETDTEIRWIGRKCETMQGSRLQIELSSAHFRLDSASANRLVVAIGPEEPSSTIETARAFLHSPQAHPAWQRLDLQVSGEDP